MGRAFGGLGLDAAAAALVAAPHPLLVAADVDGTLSPLVPRADQAALLPGAREAIDGLLRQGVAVAIVSGRGLADLRAQFDWPDGLRLIGSHGLEDSATYEIVLTAEERQHLQGVRMLSERASRAVAGTWVEEKVAGVAFHYRQATRASAGSLAAKRLEEQLERLDGVWVRRGHLVVEAAVRPATKAQAVEQLRADYGAATVVYLGDDETDEDVFRVLGPPHITVRVGPGESAAVYRLADPGEVVALLSVNLAHARV